MESQKTSQVELETEIEDPKETEEPGEPINTGSVDTRESLTPQQSEDEFLLFSSQLFEHEDEAYKESLISSPVPSIKPAVSGGETLTTTVPTAGSSKSQDAEPSTSAEDSNPSSRGLWDKARQLASQRRKSGQEHNRGLSNNDGKITTCVTCFSGLTQIIAYYQVCIRAKWPMRLELIPVSVA